MPSIIDQDKRFEIVQMLRDYCNDPKRFGRVRLKDGTLVTSKTGMVNHLAETNALSNVTIWHWLRRYTQGGPSALADRPRSDKHTSRWFKKYPKARGLAAYLYRDCKQSIQMICNAIKKEADLIGVPEVDLPSYGTVRSFLKSGSPSLAVYAREGREAYRERMSHCPQVAKPSITSQVVAKESLDPADWAAFRAQAHLMLDDMLGYIEKIRERPVWQQIPTEIRTRFRSSAPRTGEELAAVHEEFMQNVLPYTQGNVHPGFMGWVNGGGTPVGVVAEMLAAGLNANLGGRDHIPVEVERQVTAWVREIFGFPQGATGLFVTGTSMANLIAVLIARDATLGFDVRASGVAAEPRRLTAYTSNAVHGCVPKAMDIAGLGSDALRQIPTDSRFRIDLAALAEAIQRDREAGFTPFLVVGTAGTVNTGAVDDLAGLADLCQREKLWFHVDGAFGALARLAPDLAPKFDGIERADSLAFDFHKWGQAPYDAGFILVRDGEAHKNAFALPAAYLQRAERGLAAGSPWPCDFGPDLSRGFRALKVWFTLKVYGTEALGASISRCCALARYLEERIAATPELELMAPVELNIVCFRYRAEDTNRVNDAIVVALQESGVVAPSTTRIAGRTAIRAAIVNHRTSRAEIDALVDGVLALGRGMISG
jgi:glutamate/tyrosine decarboxylase-like PLP-dependent enzyme